MIGAAADHCGGASLRRSPIASPHSDPDCATGEPDQPAERGRRDPELEHREPRRGRMDHETDHETDQGPDHASDEDADHRPPKRKWL
jgi:hypothetical protein